MTGREARAIRLAKDYTNRELARQRGCAQSRVSSWEHAAEVPADIAAWLQALPTREPGRIDRRRRGGYGRNHQVNILPAPRAAAERSPGALPSPAFEGGGVRLYQGDARELFPLLELERQNTVVITDPVWPDAPPGMFRGIDGPTAAYELFAEVARHFGRARRAVVILGDGSDPRFLRAVPAELVFLRTAWIRYDRPIPRAGRLLQADVAYVFGRKRQDEHVIPGEVTITGDERATDGHPCPRDERGMRWLVQHCTTPQDVVVDPFAGSGTTGRAAQALNRQAVLIESSAAYVAYAAQRWRERTQARLPLGGSDLGDDEGGWYA